MGLTIQSALNQASLLNEVSETARLDVTTILCHVLGKDRAYLYTWPEQQLNQTEQSKFTALLERRLAGEPVAYLIEQREFWSLPLRVSADTLIPRPETELLVTTMLEFFAPDESVKVLDLGTGSGAIALAVAAERPDWQVTGVDKSEKSVEIARWNASDLGLDHVRLISSDWYAQLSDERFNLILSNPPYIEEGDAHLQQGDVRFEPKSALISGADGLDDLRIIVSQAPSYLVSGGWLAVEHGFQQGAAVRALFEQAGFEAIATHFDLAGLERITCGQIVI